MDGRRYLTLAAVRTLAHPRGRMSFGYPHAFEAPLSRFGVGRTRKLWYTVLFLPPAIEPALPFAAHPRLRVEGEIAELPAEGAWMPTGDNRRYFMVSPKILKAAQLAIGDTVEMRFRIADQGAVDVPPELAAALAADPAARGAWAALTPGGRRGFAHLVHGAKASATRARRVADVLAAIRDGAKRPSKNRP